MTGQRSNTRSLALAVAVFAGCYEQPDIEIAVSRSSEFYNVNVFVCGGGHPCQDNAAFPSTMELTHKIFIFVDGLSDLELRLERSSPDSSVCIEIRLQDELLERTLTIGDEPDPLWGCEPSSPCDDVVGPCL